ncbi:hypothetical protein [Paraburkholderia sp. BL9I2N2]|uniref:hypothetical protein n=1 Tax=Paraburkholderia sp. BL9I2N2 TaxID=1938809 RepID=UPI00104B42A2|nr:hypothetical protein [Paraburkholderia sp. BL9I2N2]TCK87371.1 hypothetical protein B0G74_7910 [Paraburkholderia sp. BL9I2N2]
MTYDSIANPVWFDAAHTMISVDIVFHDLGTTPVKFNASPEDVMDYGREIYADLVAGKYGPIAEHTA